MSIDIDSIDVKILYAFLKNARVKLNSIAKDCSITPTAVSKRINRLKKLGVITGAVLLVDVNKIGGLYSGSIEIENIKEEQTEKVAELLNKRAVILIKSFSTGKSDASFFFITKGNIDFDNLRSILRKYSEPGKISITLWNTPCCIYENIKIESTK